MKKDPVSLQRGVRPHFLQTEVTECDKLPFLRELLYKELLNHQSDQQNFSAARSFLSPFLQDAFNQQMQIHGPSVQKTEGRKQNYTVSVLATYTISLPYSIQILPQLSFLSAGHWKSGFVPELFSNQRWLGKTGKIDFAAGYGPLLANGAAQTALFMAMAQSTSTVLHFWALWVCVWMCSFSVHMLPASSCGSGSFSWC